MGLAKEFGMARSLTATLAFAAACMPSMAAAQSIPEQPSAASDEGHLEALAGSLADGLNCNASALRDALEERTRRTGEAPADIGVALALISSSANVCPPVRVAASALSQDFVAKQAAAQQAAQLSLAANPPPAVTDPQTELALEAEVRAESTKFSEGPPPRKLTRTRIASP